MQITIDLKPDQLAELTCSNKVELSTLKPRDEFRLGDEIFIVLEQTENGTRVITKEFAYSHVRFGDSSDWRVSLIRKVLNNEYFNKIADIVGVKNILTMDRDLTSLDGLYDYGTCIDKVSLLTFAEYAEYHKILGLKPDYPSWWWLITPMSTPSNDYVRNVCHVFASGIINWCDCDVSCGVRPFLTLESSISVLANRLSCPLIKV